MYFFHHSTIGKYGMEAQAQMIDQAARLEFKLASLRQEREVLASRVMLLKDGNIEYDMLDEQVRYQLNLLHEDEVVIMRVEQ